MTLKKIKQEMKAYRDLFGGQLINSDEIDRAKTKKELAGIIDKHKDFMDSMLADAETSLVHFKRSIGLEGI